MSHEPEHSGLALDHPSGAGRHWSTTSFLTGILLGAAVGAGLALIFAPASGDETRRLIRRRAGAVRRGAAESWASAKDQTRDGLRQRKEAIRERLAKGVERLSEELGV